MAFIWVLFGFQKPHISLILGFWNNKCKYVYILCIWWLKIYMVNVFSNLSVPFFLLWFISPRVALYILVLYLLLVILEIYFPKIGSYKFKSDIH